MKQLARKAKKHKEKKILKMTHAIHAHAIWKPISIKCVFFNIIIQFMLTQLM